MELWPKCPRILYMCTLHSVGSLLLTVVYNISSTLNSYKHSRVYLCVVSHIHWLLLSKTNHRPAVGDRNYILAGAAAAERNGSFEAADK
jgi:hypothetical protein